jgi:hypothetical protein
VLSLRVRAAWQRAATVIVPRRVVRLAGSWTGAASEELAWHVRASRDDGRRAGQIEACATNARVLFCDGYGHGPMCAAQIDQLRDSRRVVA